MKKKMKTENVAQVFAILNAAHYGKIADEDKIKLWKIARSMKPVAMKFQEDAQDASRKLIPYEEYGNRLQLAKQYEAAHAKGDTFDKMTDDEYRAFLEDFRNYNKLVGDAVKEFANAEVEIQFEPISEEAFAKLMASNQWTIEQTMTLSDYIVEQ